MHDTRLIGAFAFAAALLMAPASASAFDESKYPDLKGQWDRLGNPPSWAPAGKPPLTAEYQAVYEANRADMVNGGAPAGVQFGTPTRSHCPLRSGYFDSSSMRALAEAISAAVNARAANRRKSCIDITSPCAALVAAATIVVLGWTPRGQPAGTIHQPHEDANGRQWAR